MNPAEALTAPPLTMPMIYTLVVMVVMIILFLTPFIRNELVALLVLSTVGILGLVPANQVFSGFASEAVVDIIAVMIIGAGLRKSGLIYLLTKYLLRISKESVTRLHWTLSLTTGLLAGLLRSLGGCVMMLPMADRISAYRQIPKSKLLMPLGFTAITGGTLTMVGSGPMLVLNDIMRKFSTDNPSVMFHPIHVFTVTPIGLCLLIAVTLFFWKFGKKLLPAGDGDNFQSGVDTWRFRKTYGFGGHFFEITLTPDSPVKDMTLSQLEELLESWKIAAIAISSEHEVYIPPTRDYRFTLDSRIALVGKDNKVRQFCEQHGLVVQERLDRFAHALNPTRSGFSEVAILPGSDMIGATVGELHMRHDFGVQVLSIFRNKRERHGYEMENLTLRSGDSLGLFSKWKVLSSIEDHSGFFVVTTDYPKTSFRKHKQAHALLSLLLSLVLIIFSPFDAAICFILGATSMMVTGVIDADDAYRSVSWRTVFLLAGLIPFGIAMQNTGTVSWIAHGVLFLFGGLSHWILLGGICILAAIFGLLMSNVGATIVLAPIAMYIAMSVGADPRTFAIVTALATANAFLIPTHQVNAVIVGQGCYKTMDFIKVGSIVSVIYLVVLLSVAYLYLP